MSGTYAQHVDTSAVFDAVQRLRGACGADTPEAAVTRLAKHVQENSGLVHMLGHHHPAVQQAANDTLATAVLDAIRLPGLLPEADVQFAKARRVMGEQMIEEADETLTKAVAGATQGISADGNAPSTQP